MIKETQFIIRRFDERGHADHGWLNTHHTFSFADYYDPAQMGFRSLRVINDDIIAPGGGFPPHPHRETEIFSYILEGQLKHSDSMGNERVLEPGQIQLMSAGTGVKHSEFNPSSDKPVHLLQIWILPERSGITPRYTEWHPSPQSQSSKTLVISPDGRENSATIMQDAHIYRIKLDAQESINHTLADGRGAWLQIVRGSAVVDGQTLSAGDAISTESAGTFVIKAADDGVEALLFDLG